MLTLAEYKTGLRDHLDQMVVDEFRRNSELLDRLAFDTAVAANGNGSTMNYGYLQLKTPSGAGTRAINSDYTPNDAKREERNTHCVILGGMYELDRVVAKTSGALDEVAFQTRDKIKATANLFHYMALNGVEKKDESTGSYTEFNGLSKLLTGASTEATAEVDISTSAKLDSNYQAFLDEIDAALAAMLVKPDMLIMNRFLKLKIISAARRAGYYERTENSFGKPVETYNGIIMLDAGEYYDKTASTSKFAVPTDTTTGKTDLFAVSLDRDGFIGVTTQDGANMITNVVPDFTRAEAVQKGSVEMIAAVALKNTKKAAVLRGIQIQAGSAG